VNWLVFCSQLVTPFQVDSVEPFKVEPADGTVQPYTSLKLTALFHPKVMSFAFANSAPCKYAADCDKPFSLIPKKVETICRSENVYRCWARFAD